MRTKLLLLFMTLLSLTLSAQNPQIQGKPKVYLKCYIQEFNHVNNSFAIQLSNQLREQGWIIVNTPEKADYLLTINSEAREYNDYVTKEETTYTTSKYRDTVLVVDGMYSNLRADSIEAGAFGEKAYGNSIGMQAEQVHTTVTRNKEVTEKHQTPVEFMYFAYMDTQVQLSNKEDEVLYENVFEIKDGHPISYDEAARGAAAKTIKQLADILPSKITK